MFRTIKITAGMTQEFEIIWTDAPNELIEKQLTYNGKMEIEGKIIKNPYGIIEENGYTVNALGSNDSMTYEDLEEVIIDEEFDYYDYMEDWSMSDLTHLFKVGQKVTYRNNDFDAVRRNIPCIVKETYPDHIIITDT